LFQEAVKLIASGGVIAMLQIDESREGDAVVLHIAGRLDAVTAPDLEGKLDGLASGGCTKLVLDFERIEMIASAGLRVFLSFAKKCRKSGARLALCRMQPVVFDVFKISNFTEILAVFPTREEAVRSVSS
jgi:anti-sigma B factor antagonist